jgi:hypothetical protein
VCGDVELVVLDCSLAKLMALVDVRLLRRLTDARGGSSPSGYVVSFITFHEHGFSVLASRF